MDRFDRMEQAFESLSDLIVALRVRRLLVLVHNVGHCRNPAEMAGEIGQPLPKIEWFWQLLIDLGVLDLRSGATAPVYDDEQKMHVRRVCMQTIQKHYHPRRRRDPAKDAASLAYWETQSSGAM